MTRPCFWQWLFYTLQITMLTNNSRNKRWNFICSYFGISTAGLGIVLISLIVHIIRHIPFKGHELRDIISDFPKLFLTGTIPVIFAMTVFLFICNLTTIRHEGFKKWHLLGTAFGCVCLIFNLLCRYTIFTEIIACYYICIFIGTVIMSYAAALNKPGHDKDYIIILGCYIGKQVNLLPLLRQRINRAIRFAWDQEIDTGKAACYVPTGGRGYDEIMSEGSAMELYLLSHSAEQYEILAEKKAVNTEENFIFSKKLMDNMKSDYKTVYVTTNYHVLRSGMIARKAGLNAEGLASDTKWDFWPNAFIREYIAILSMYRKSQLAAFALIIIYVIIRNS